MYAFLQLLCIFWCIHDLCSLLPAAVYCWCPAGPDSWSYWAPKEQTRKMMSAEATHEGGNYGPGSWMYWQKQRQLLAAQAANEGGNYGEWLDWCPKRNYTAALRVAMTSRPCSAAGNQTGCL
jgi:hypothetical protein